MVRRRRAKTHLKCAENVDVQCGKLKSAVVERKKSEKIGDKNGNESCVCDILNGTERTGRFSFSSAGIPEGGSCNSNKRQTTRSVKQCVAGAACVNSTCKCLAGVSTKTGVLCGGQLNEVLL